MCNQPNRQKANEQGVESASEVGDKRALAVRQGCDGQPCHVRGRLLAATFEGAGMGDIEELALGRPRAERRYIDAEARHLGGQAGTSV